MSKYTIVVACALYSDYGIYTPQQRIAQTLETVDSIRKYIPNSTILLIDNSKIDVQNDNSTELNQLLDAVDYYFDNSEDPDIQYFHNNVSNYDVGKNSMETLGTLKVFKHILEDQEVLDVIKNSNRVFKLSGRYVITDQFDLTKFDNEFTKDKYVFKKAAKAWIPEADTGVTTLLQTRFFAFDPSLLEDTVTLYRQILGFPHQRMYGSEVERIKYRSK